MSIALFGYRFYPAFFFIIIGVPLLIAIVFNLFKLIKNNKEKKVEDNIFKITDFERKTLKVLLKDIEGEDYINSFLEEEDSWQDLNKEEINLREINNRIFDYVKMNIDEEEKYLSLAKLLRALDFINGAFPIEKGEKIWIDEDIYEAGYFMNMNKYEARLENIYITQIENKMAYIDMDINKIPSSSLVYYPLKTLFSSDFQIALDDIVGSERMILLKDSTRRIIKYCLVDTIVRFIKDTDEIQDFKLYYIRALCCILSNKMYLDMLDEIS